jgi:hypothetical protein
MKKLQRKQRPTNNIEVIEPITKQSKKKHDSEPVWAMVPCFKEGEDLETATKLWQSLLSSHKKKPRDGKLCQGTDGINICLEEKTNFVWIGNSSWQGSCKIPTTLPVKPCKYAQ